jgi:DNA-binding NarL/FixJ family response regulator
LPPPLVTNHSSIVAAYSDRTCLDTVNGLPDTTLLERAHSNHVTKRVLLVDDNKGMRQALRMLFESEPDFEVVGEAEHGQEAIEKAEVLKPHLIILDFSMPVMNGLEAAPILRRKLPSVILILFSNYAASAMEAPAREAGIHAIVPKHQASTHLMPTVHDLFAGQTPVPTGEPAVA